MPPLSSRAAQPRLAPADRSVSAQPAGSSTFAERYCAQFNVEPARYRDAVLPRILHGPAGWFHSFLRLAKPDYFAADYDFIDGVGRIVQRREFSTEAEEFIHNPANRGFLRRTCRLRGSVGRMQQLVNEVFGEVTTHPFPARNSPPPF